MAMNPLDLLRMRKMALAGANRRPAAAAFLDMAGQTGQAPQAPMPSIAEGARLRALKALGASQQPTPAITKPKLITADNTVSGAGSMLPGRGTPGSAALGAFGSTMSQLGGWQDKPMTFGQILGASLGKAREAYGTAEERQRQIAADKAAALAAAEEKEYQRQQDAKKFRLEESKVKATARSDADKHYADAERMGLTGTMADEYVRSQLMKTKSTKPSGFVSVYTKDGDFVENVREDSPEADDYANKGYRIVESTTISGTKGDVGFGLSKADYSKKVLSQFSAQENIRELENVKAGFQDRFLTLQGKFGLFGAKVLDMIGSSKPEHKQFIAQQTKWKTDAWNQVNKYIKEITGAQMSEAEAKRILNALPNPSTDMFKLTSPTEYKSALDTALRNAKMAVARQQYFLNKGLKPEYYETSLSEDKRLGSSGFDVIYRDEKGNLIEYDDMPKIMDSYTDEIAAKYETDKYSNLTEDQKIAMINQEVDSYFGLANTPGQGIQHG